MKKSRLEEIIKEEINRLFDPTTNNDLNLIKDINNVEEELRNKGISYNEYSKAINYITLGDDLGQWMDSASEESLEEVLEILRGLLNNSN